MLQIKDINFAYKKDIEVLSKLSLNLNSNEIHGLVGLNGSGKTTLLNIIFGNLKPQTGQIFFNDKIVRKEDIAFLETENFFYSKITGAEYLEIFRFSNKKFNIANWNEIFKLPLNTLIENYSTGMKKKLAIISVLSFDKPIYILDEPFNGIDLETNQIIKNIIFKLKQNGKTIIITSHIFEILQSVCDSISFLNNKQIEFTKLKSEFDDVENMIFKRINSENESSFSKLF